jgi:hypothetical protein
MPDKSKAGILAGAIRLVELAEYYRTYAGSGLDTDTVKNAEHVARDAVRKAERAVHGISAPGAFADLEQRARNGPLAEALAADDRMHILAEEIRRLDPPPHELLLAYRLAVDDDEKAWRNAQTEYNARGEVDPATQSRIDAGLKDAGRHKKGVEDAGTDRRELDKKALPSQDEPSSTKLWVELLRSGE